MIYRIFIPTLFHFLIYELNNVVATCYVWLLGMQNVASPNRYKIHTIIQRLSMKKVMSTLTAF